MSGLPSLWKGGHGSIKESDAWGDLAKSVVELLAKLLLVHQTRGSETTRAGLNFFRLR